jgi:hypothetical protein
LAESALILATRQRSEDPKGATRSHRRAKAVFPGPDVTHKEGKETKEDRKRGEPSRTGLVSCAYEVCGARGSLRLDSLIRLLRANINLARNSEPQTTRDTHKDDEYMGSNYTLLVEIIYTHRYISTSY